MTFPNEIEKSCVITHIKHIYIYIYIHIYMYLYIYAAHMVNNFVLWY